MFGIYVVGQCNVGGIVDDVVHVAVNCLVVCVVVVDVADDVCCCCVVGLVVDDECCVDRVFTLIVICDVLVACLLRLLLFWFGIN